MLYVPAVAVSPTLAFKMLESATLAVIGKIFEGVLIAAAAVCRVDSALFKVPKVDILA